jgi:hypothetical protein
LSLTLPSEGIFPQHVLQRIKKRRKPAATSFLTVRVKAVNLKAVIGAGRHATALPRSGDK